MSNIFQAEMIRNEQAKAQAKNALSTKQVLRQAFFPP